MFGSMKLFEFSLLKAQIFMGTRSLPVVTFSLNIQWH